MIDSRVLIKRAQGYTAPMVGAALGAGLAGGASMLSSKQRKHLLRNMLLGGLGGGGIGYLAGRQTTPTEAKPTPVTNVQPGTTADTQPNAAVTPTKGPGLRSFLPLRVAARMGDAYMNHRTGMGHVAEQLAEQYRLSEPGEFAKLYGRTVGRVDPRMLRSMSIYDQRKGKEQYLQTLQQQDPKKYSQIMADPLNPYAQEAKGIFLEDTADPYRVQSNTAWKIREEMPYLATKIVNDPWIDTNKDELPVGGPLTSLYHMLFRDDPRRTQQLPNATAVANKFHELKPLSDSAQGTYFSSSDTARLKGPRNTERLTGELNHDRKVFYNRLDDADTVAHEVHHGLQHRDANPNKPDDPEFQYVMNTDGTNKPTVSTASKEWGAISAGAAAARTYEPEAYAALKALGKQPKGYWYNTDPETNRFTKFQPMHNVPPRYFDWKSYKEKLKQERPGLTDREYYDLTQERIKEHERQQLDFFGWQPDEEDRDYGEGVYEHTPRTWAGLIGGNRHYAGETSLNYDPNNPDKDVADIPMRDAQAFQLMYNTPYVLTEDNSLTPELALDHAMRQRKNVIGPDAIDYRLHEPPEVDLADPNWYKKLEAYHAKMRELRQRSGRTSVVR